MRRLLPCFLLLTAFALGCDNDAAVSPATDADDVRVDGGAGDIDVQTPGADINVDVENGKRRRIRIPDVDVNVDSSGGGVDVKVQRDGAE
jgi:hypothetical protein